MTQPITIVVGGQWGSEAKGTIAAHICVTEAVDFAVRTGAVNAGHTVEYGGKYYAMQQLPVGWINPNTALVIGAGALVDPNILRREREMIKEATGRDPIIYVDYRAYLHRPVHTERSTQSGRHHAIGATGKGCSEALIDRVRLRGSVNWTVGAVLADSAPNPDRSAFEGCMIIDTEEMLNHAVDNGKKVLLEGCQGTLLDLVLGPYPYTTHKQTTPAQWMSEVGLSPALPTDIVMVLRTMPIRVAGNSGPMGAETSWPDLARRINLQRRAIAPSPLDPIVKESSLLAFEAEVRKASGRYAIPYGSDDGLDQHKWTIEQREQYTAALSEINTEALRSVGKDVMADLRNLFEITTVTKKLRRIAEITDSETVAAIRQVRPHRVAVTFMNYIFSDLWGSGKPVTSHEHLWLNENIHVPLINSGIAGVPVFAINRGPSFSSLVRL